MNEKASAALRRVWERAGCGFVFCAFLDPMGPVAGVLAVCDCLKDTEILVGLIDLAKLLRQDAGIAP